MTRTEPAECSNCDVRTLVFNDLQFLIPVDQSVCEVDCDGIRPPAHSRGFPYAVSCRSFASLCPAARVNGFASASDTRHFVSNLSRVRCLVAPVITLGQALGATRESTITSPSAAGPSSEFETCSVGCKSLRLTTRPATNMPSNAWGSLLPTTLSRLALPLRACEKYLGIDPQMPFN